MSRYPSGMRIRDITGKKSLRKRLVSVAHRIRARVKESRGKNMYRAMKAGIVVVGRNALSMAKNSATRSRA
jgi:hypothetical protein